jgi:dTDP-4-amino-4,6-dideoxygalactose transaminase
MKRPEIAFIDLKAQQRRLGGRLVEAMAAVLDGGHFILGPQVAQFERELAAFAGTRHAIGVANGTDAIGLSLMALGLKPGDAVICPTFTFAATAEAVAWLGATPVFVDIEKNGFTLDPAALPLALAAARMAGLKTKAVIAVDLFGHCADYDPIEAFCRTHGLVLICDAAQSFGAGYKGRRVGKIGDITTTSFFPAKPLGCYGDGGAVLLNDDGRAGVIRSLRSHGKGDDKYDHVRIGVNSRLDTLQAAILIEKLAIFEEEIAAREVAAARYADGLGDVAILPRVMPGSAPVWAQYTIRVPAARRAAIVTQLAAEGVPTAIYYPRPLHRQPAYSHYPIAGNALPASDHAATEVLSLPMHPYLDRATQDYIIRQVRAALKAG